MAANLTATRSGDRRWRRERGHARDRRRARLPGHGRREVCVTRCGDRQATVGVRLLIAGFQAPKIGVAINERVSAFVHYPSFSALTGSIRAARRAGR